MKFWYWVMAAAISILTWMLVAAGFALLRSWDPDPFSITATYSDRL